MPRSFLLPLFTQVRGRRILRTSPRRGSRKLAPPRSDAPRPATGCNTYAGGIIRRSPPRWRTGAMRLALKWGDGLSRLLRGIPRPVLLRTAPRSAHRSRLLDRRRKEGEAARQPHGRGLRPPRVPTLHAADRRPRSSIADRPDAAFSNFAYRGVLGSSSLKSPDFG